MPSSENPALRRFGTLKVHADKHPMFADKFNPYSNRDFTPALDETYFKALLDSNPDHCGLAIDHCFTGCLDAPEYIPGGSSERIQTIGGYEREEYTKLHRECDDIVAMQQAQAETAKMLKEILASIDD